jgi:hypothetical protein
MSATIYLDPLGWDLVIDATGSIAMASDPYSLAQDAASAVRAFEGEVWYDTTAGVPYWTQILGHPVPLSLIREAIRTAALTVPGVTGAAVYFDGLADRRLTGQVQVSSATGTAAATF